MLARKRGAGDAGGASIVASGPTVPRSGAGGGSVAATTGTPDAGAAGHVRGGGGGDDYGGGDPDPMKIPGSGGGAGLVSGVLIGMWMTRGSGEIDPTGGETTAASSTG